MPPPPPPPPAIPHQNVRMTRGVMPVGMIARIEAGHPAACARVQAQRQHEQHGSNGERRLRPSHVRIAIMYTHVSYAGLVHAPTETPAVWGGELLGRPLRAGAGDV